MDKKDKDIESALDDIFGSDFIEIDLNNVENKDYNKTVLDENINTPYVSNETILDNNKEIKNDKDSNEKSLVGNKKIYIIISVLIVLISIFVLMYVFCFKTKVVKCTSFAKDNGYEYKDEYKITHKGNKISYVESIYTYNALNDEYKEQIKYIKDDKIRVIINSNGMPGFTYLYETNDDYLKINGYLDFELFDFKQINGINQESTPISYFKINSNMKFRSLKKTLKKEGYKCNVIK